MTPSGLIPRGTGVGGSDVQYPPHAPKCIPRSLPNNRSSGTILQQERSRNADGRVKYREKRENENEVSCIGA